MNFLSFLEIEKQFGVQCIIWAVNDIPQLFYRLSNVLFRIYGPAFRMSLVYEDI